MIKAIKKLGMKGSYLNIIKTIYDKPIAKIKLNEEKPENIPLVSEMRKGVYYHCFYPIKNLRF
jgi:hypothetical protein